MAGLSQRFEFQKEEEACPIIFICLITTSTHIIALVWCAYEAHC